MFLFFSVANRKKQNSIFLLRTQKKELCALCASVVNLSFLLDCDRVAIYWCLASNFSCCPPLLEDAKKH